MSDIETRTQYEHNTMKAHGEVIALRRDQHGR